MDWKKLASTEALIDQTLSLSERKVDIEDYVFDEGQYVVDMDSVLRSMFGEGGYYMHQLGPYADELTVEYDRHWTDFDVDAEAVQQAADDFNFTPVSAGVEVVKCWNCENYFEPGTPCVLSDFLGMCERCKGTNDDPARWQKVDGLRQANRYRDEAQEMLIAMGLCTKNFPYEVDGIPVTKGYNTRIASLKG